MLEMLPAANEELRRQIAYVRQEDHVAAQKVHDSVFRRLRLLLQFPRLGRESHVAGFFVITVDAYGIYYRIRPEEAIEVHAVIHDRSDRSRCLREFLGNKR